MDENDKFYFMIRSEMSLGHGRAEKIQTSGNRMTPSCDALTYTDQLIGDAGENLPLLQPINTIFGDCSRKRMKQKWKDDNGVYGRTKIAMTVRRWR
uniref:Uncharacterized protein n=1 Tax=Salix viminalis TaxID=40686 RepID=A0A6N2NL09_SALVM